jgi:putative hydrolase of the HAD superfamily
LSRLPDCTPLAEFTLSPSTSLRASPEPSEGTGSAKGSGHGLRAVLFDAGNTLVFLDYARLAEGVSAALGLSLTTEGLALHASAAARAMELAAGTDQERAAAYLEALFLLNGVPAQRLGEVRSCLGRMHQERHLWSAVAAGSRESLARLRAAGLRLGVVSNSDGRVEQALRAAGLRQYFDVVVDSALVGVEKPDPRIFQAALTALGVAPEETLYVGDLYEIDVIGARAAGIEAVLLGCAEAGSYPSCRTASSIEDLVNSLLAGETLMGPTPIPNAGP